MIEVVWKAPSPSSGFTHGVDVETRPGREIALRFDFENAAGEAQSGELIFKQVVHYRATYLYALRAEMINEAYDKVVDQGKSEELIEVIAALNANQQIAAVKHYRVCFNDGPCFDFMAAHFEAVVPTTGRSPR
jgi:hypothetical protein